MRRPVRSPAELPPATNIDLIEEPYVRCSVLVPQEGVGAVMGLCQDRRGVFVTMEPIEQRQQIVYDLPLAEIVLDFYDQLKSPHPRLRLARLRDHRLPREPAGEARRAPGRRHR